MISAVIFDLGGVVLESPFEVIADFEAAAGVSPGLFGRAASLPNGAWTALETGAISRDEFVGRFESDCQLLGERIDAGGLLPAIEAHVRPRPVVLAAMEKLRAAGLVVAALTNNWQAPSADWDLSAFRSRFDVFVESWVEGVRKPDPEIYEIIMCRLDRDPSVVVFLDDIGQNLKSARRLGLTTIKVDEIDEALRELGKLTGVRLAQTG